MQRWGRTWLPHEMKLVAKKSDTAALQYSSLAVISFMGYSATRGGSVSIRERGVAVHWLDDVLLCHPERSVIMNIYQKGVKVVNLVPLFPCVLKIGNSVTRMIVTVLVPLLPLSVLKVDAVKVH